jgi:Tol biopolymer transport system component
MARYSYDGKKIVFVKTPIKEGLYSYDYERMQIATMNPDGSDVRTITKHVGPKFDPSFSHSGDKIIFIQAGRVQTERRVPTAKHDVYEVEVATGKATQLTHYAFSEIGQPFYLPDDKQFVFSAYFLTSFPGLTEYETIKKKREEFEAKYRHNTIFIMSPTNQELKPILVHGEHSMNARMTRDGKTLRFVAPFKNPQYPSRYLYEIFERAEGGEIVMKTSLGMGPLWQFAMSPDGNLMAVQYEIFSGDSLKRNTRQLAVISTRDNTVRVIPLPAHARTIN